MRERLNLNIMLGKRELRPYRTGGLRPRSYNVLLIAAAAAIAWFAGCAIAPDWLAPYPPTEMSSDSLMQPPSWAHPFGTDYFGRDVLSLVVYGSRDSLFIGVASILIGGLAGGAIGAISGYIGGLTDAVFMRAVDVLMTIPGVLLALAVASALGPSLFNMVAAVSLGTIPGFARLMRGQTLGIKNRPYIVASRSVGVTRFGIYWKHVLPNSLSPLVVMATLGIGGSILTGSGLSFLGVGVLKEIPDWGELLSQGRSYLTVAWWICTFPGLAIALLVLSVNVIGDWLRDRLDPRRRGEAN
ncbi:ABC transporter permease [Cohnella xylanilytica]|uniref:ABC transporter permease n=1 Tax=Cohnella xylanilytica TaxID=557555 RepID=A0A841TSG4_9BACL|nr:ABC transporter permease [Cohnella xylanilytica]MBB6691367.1 ABC transporter permease [Cohnella xylanilytica]